MAVVKIEILADRTTLKEMLSPLLRTYPQLEKLINYYDDIELIVGDSAAGVIVEGRVFTIWRSPTTTPNNPH